MSDFAGKTALITGAASGIGLACAQDLAGQGATTLILIDRHEAGLDAARATLGHCGRTIVTAAMDIADEAAWDAVDLEGLDHAVLSAGIAGSGAIADLAFDEWRRILSVNLDGTFLSLRAAMRAMETGAKGGSIVLVSSAAGLKAEPATAAYGTSKAALLHLAKVAAREGAAQKIRVNAIAPAGVETPMWSDQAFFRDLAEKAGSEAAAYAALAAQSPLGRFARPDEIAAQIRFLLSDAAATITGTTLTSDGGYLL